MTIGIIHYDISQRGIIDKLWRAARAFKAQFGINPEMALINENAGFADDGSLPFQVRVYKRALPGHVWVIVEYLPKEI